MPSIANPFATSFPCTLTCAGTCSHLTSLPGVAISWSSISQTGTWTCSFPDVVVHPFDFQCWALPVAPSCRYCESVRIASFGTQNPCKASTAEGGREGHTDGVMNGQHGVAMETPPPVKPLLKVISRHKTPGGSRSKKIAVP